LFLVFIEKKKTTIPFDHRDLKQQQQSQPTSALPQQQQQQSLQPPSSPRGDPILKDLQVVAATTFQKFSKKIRRLSEPKPMVGPKKKL